MREDDANEMVTVPKVLLVAALNIFDRLEAYVDGVLSAAGQHGVPPLALEHLDDWRNEIHPFVCDHCASDERAHEARSNLKTIDGGKPKDKLQ